MNKEKSTIFVGLSGGVDSAVSAALLRDQGYEVVGIFMKNWSGDDYGIQEDCPWEEDQAMAEQVCKTLGIEFRSFNFEKEYRQKVVDYFFSEYQKGRTPNPDIMCNKEIKFRMFLDKAQGLGADMIATGHYARVSQQLTANSHENESEYQLMRGVDANKDQTYFLYTLSQEQLSRTLFPIGHLEKPEVRKLAHEYKLPNAARPDSQGICFIGEINVYKYLRAKIPLNPGNIVDIDTQEIVGQHDGVYFYTIGQREGLKLGGQKIPYYVVGKDHDQNIVYVGHGGEHPKLLTKIVHLESWHFINQQLNDKNENETKEKLTASLRYRQKSQPGILDLEQMTFTFDEPQRAATSGQSLVAYEGDICVGGGVIA